MKKLRNLIAVMAMASMATMLTGCGDDDDGDDDDNGGGNNTNNPTLFAPADQATLTAQNRTYNVNVAGQEPITLTFPSAGNYQIVQGGATETGTIANATRTDNTWVMDVTPAAGQDGTTNGVLNLTWTGDNAGTWTFTPAGGQAETGNFTVTVGGGNPDTGGDNGGNTGGGWPTNNDLSGRILQFQYTGGGGDKFTFTGPSTHQWENNTATGGYTFDRTTGNIQLTIPSRGETFSATLTPGSTSGNTTVTLSSSSGNQDLPATYTLSNPQ